MNRHAMSVAIRLCCVLALTTAVPLRVFAEPQSEVKPNVLFISIDDLRTTLGCYGDTLVRSPNIDRLASEGRLFQRAYCHQAVCGPSRTSILTGLLPDRTRVWHNRHRFREACPDWITLPQLFKQHGYQALSLGKVLSGSMRELDPVSWSVPEVLRKPGWKTYALQVRDGGRKGLAMEAADVADEGYADGQLAALAVKTLERLKDENQPFFLAVGFFKPHLPFNAPKKYWDLYSPEMFEANAYDSPVANAPDIAYHSHRELAGYRDIPKDERVTAEQARDLRHGYHACVSYVDAQVGKLLHALNRLGLTDKTIVVLWGDHGYALGEQQRWCKGTNFELDTRVPLVIRTPDLALPGSSTDSLVQLVDIYPTLADLAGLEPPAELDGKSLVRILQNPRAQVRDVTRSQFARPFKPNVPEAMGYSIRTATHRYTRWVRWPGGKTIAEELYDDSSEDSVSRSGALSIERRNLIDDPGYDHLARQMRERFDNVITVGAGADGAGRPVRPDR